LQQPQLESYHRGRAIERFFCRLGLLFNLRRRMRRNRHIGLRPLRRFDQSCAMRRIRNLPDFYLLGVV